MTTTYYPSSPPFPPDAWGIELPQGFGKGDVESLLQNIVQKLSECISARSADIISLYPYYTGSSFVLPSRTADVLQQYVQWTVPAGGGTTLASLLVSSPIAPIEIYGVATSSTGTNIIAYPVGYNAGSTSLSAFFTNNSVNITATASLAGYTVTVVVRYVYYIPQE
jgi:hypothetical protein